VLTIYTGREPTVATELGSDNRQIAVFIPLLVSVPGKAT
jgi:hypothetical protein